MKRRPVVQDRSHMSLAYFPRPCSSFFLWLLDLESSSSRQAPCITGDISPPRQQRGDTFYYQTAAPYVVMSGLLTASTDAGPHVSLSSPNICVSVPQCRSVWPSTLTLFKGSWLLMCPSHPIKTKHCKKACGMPHQQHR